MSPLAGRGLSPGWAVLAEGAVQLEGPDAVRFANGQLTADVRSLPVGSGAPTAWLDDRGRILGFGAVFRTAEQVVLVASESCAAADLLQHLDSRHFVDDLQLSPRGGWWVTVQGATEVAASARSSSLGWFEHRRSPWAEGVDAWLDATAALPLPDPTRVPPEEVERWRVAAGLLRWPVDGGPKALPHELGWRARYLAFGKGCYVGQEAIQRIDVLGGVRRGPRGLVGVPPGAATGQELSWEGRPMGVVGTVFAAPEGVRALALVRLEVPLGATVDLPAGPAVVVELPWSDERS